ncbi:MAG: hypothetical protein FWG85_05655 [Bacteroidetes bacterium]|nr:hypothetical protein [Bacteroidota bacterium]
MSKFLILFSMFLVTFESAAEQVLFYEHKEAMNNALKQFDSLPKGWKQLERSASFWQRRLNQNGEITSPKCLYNEAKTFLDKQLKKNNDHLLTSEKWELLGPEISLMDFGNGKVNCVYASPINDSLLFLGSASGGLWRSTNAGDSWQVIEWTDFISNGIMDIAISPSHPNIMYATSGDPYGVNLFKSYSLGVLKSVDGGNVWDLLMPTLDFADSLAFFEILVHPENPDIVITTTNKNILKSIDGGITWSEVLADGYFRDMKFMPNNPDVIYATNMMGYEIGGCKMFMSKDCGESWNEIAEFPLGRRIELEVTPQNPYSLYVLVGSYTTRKGAEGLYKFNFSNDTIIIDTIFNINNITFVDEDGDLKPNNATNYINGQSFHNLTIGVSPLDSNLIIVGGVYCAMTTNGGKTWSGLSTGHPDHHDIKFIDTFIYLSHDGGIDRIGVNELLSQTNKRSKDCSKGLAITQYYRVGPHNFIPNKVMGGSQDNGTHFLYNEIWSHVGGGDGMFCQFHPLIPDKRYMSTQRTSWGINEKFPWISTFLYTTHSLDTFLIIGENVYEVFYQRDTTDGVIRNNRHSNKLSDFFPWGWYDPDTRALAYSPTDKNYIYAARGGHLHITNNYGEDWQDIISLNAPISCINVSENNPEVFWFSCMGNVENEKVYKYNNGEITNLSYNIPNIAVNSVAFYPLDSSLFIGTDMGVMRLRNGNTEWELFSNGMPYTSVMDIKYIKQTGLLYAVTWGRGMWSIKLNDCWTEPPILNFLVDTIICTSNFPVIAYLKNKEKGSKYIWNDGSTDEVLLIYNYGEYCLYKESAEGCGSVSVKITVARKYEGTNVARLLSRNPACIGDTVKYVANKNSFPYSFEWSNGSTVDTIKITENTDLYITFDAPNQPCINTFFIDNVRFVAPAFSTPTISQVGNVLICDEEASIYEWFIDGVSQGIDNKNYIFIETPGVYELIIRDKNYCVSSAEPITIYPPINNNTIVRANIHPNPSSGKVIMELFYDGNDIADISFYDGLGGFIDSYDSGVRINHYFYDELDFSDMQSGVYYILVKIKDYQKAFRIVIKR